MSTTRSLQEHHIVIIGGGIIGCTAAYYITHHPLFKTPDNNVHRTVTLLEASTIAAGASGKAGGLVADWAYPRELTKVSFAEHKKLARKHGGEGRWGWREVECGQWEGRARPSGGKDGTSARLGSGADADGLHGHSLEGNPRSVTGRAGLPGDLDWIDEALTDAYGAMAGPGETAQVHPYEFTTSMLSLAREEAGERLEVVEGAKVVSIERASASVTADRRGGAGAESGTSTSKGDRVVGVTYEPTGGSHTHTVHIPADTVLLAAGPWSSTLMPSLPITSIRAHSIVIEPATPLSPYVLFTTIHSADNAGVGEGSPEIYARPHNRVYACGPGDDTPLPPLASLDRPSASSISELREQVNSISTPLRDGRVEVEQACYLPLGGPIVGAVDTLQGLVVATGHTCWGICNAPGTAKAVAELMMEGTLGKEWKLNKLKPSRFLNK